MHRLGLRAGARTWSRRATALAMALAITAGVPALVMAQDPSASPTAAELLASVTPGPDTSVHYVGAIEETGIYAAVVDVGAGFVNVYLCDGAEVALWFEGTGADGAFEATAADGSTVTGTIDDATASGSVTLADGTTMSFDAPRAELPAGLYERSAVEDGAGVQARTIVLPDGTAKGKKRPFPCESAEANFRNLMVQYEAAPLGSIDQQFIGLVADDAFDRARNAGCAWTSPAT
jgi:hypothetical protein